MFLSQHTSHELWLQSSPNLRLRGVAGKGCVKEETGTFLLPASSCRSKDVDPVPLNLTTALALRSVPFTDRHPDTIVLTLQHGHDVRLKCCRHDCIPIEQHAHCSSKCRAHPPSARQRLNRQPLEYLREQEGRDSAAPSSAPRWREHRRLRSGGAEAALGVLVMRAGRLCIRRELGVHSEVRLHRLEQRIDAPLPQPRGGPRAATRPNVAPRLELPIADLLGSGARPGPRTGRNAPRWCHVWQGWRPKPLVLAR
mmetsp:Transcript_126104/g.368517  ORF Transcript_126104/g.368517 Transcript_126104/m.368517 type:complete len:254 (-) Transcript_126104:142-903(-)